ncbi:MAG: hypothetical protein ABIJ83_02900, partial [Patescibacteria group bacterium]
KKFPKNLIPQFINKIFFESGTTPQMRGSRRQTHKRIRHLTLKFLLDIIIYNLEIFNNLLSKIIYENY